MTKINLAYTIEVADEVGVFSLRLNNGYLVLDPKVTNAMPADFNQLLSALSGMVPEQQTHAVHVHSYGSHVYIEVEPDGHIIAPRIDFIHRVVSMSIPATAIRSVAGKFKARTFGVKFILKN